MKLETQQINGFKLPIIRSSSAPMLIMDNYIIHEIFAREDNPEFYSAEELTHEAIPKAASLARDEELAKLGLDSSV